MDSLVVAGIVFACTFGGVVLGMALRAVVPERYLCAESRDVLKLSAGLLATLSALVLGLLIASAKSSFDTQRGGFHQMATNIVILDRSLLLYGKEETKETRQLLHKAVATLVEHRWPSDGSRSTGLDGPEITASNEAFYAALTKLTPQNETQRAIQSQAFQTSAELGRTRWQLIHGGESSIPVPFLIVLIFWLTVLFAIFGLLAPRHLATIVVLFLCALSVSGAIFLILELDQPFEGLIQISGQPLRNALSHLVP
ncbi:MAG: DUF4239 domain-containing protein [Planctomycetes bacterium]|nr:DUF4239 domain-containing protein [Planctomycetota bacterium]